MATGTGTIKQVDVKFLGKNFNFNIPDNIKTEDFLEIIDFVEDKFSHIRKEAGDLDSFRLGLLAAINIAEEFFSLKKENEKLRAVLTNIDSMLPPVDVNQENQFAISFSS
ncbi:MAG: cell division protein ZapA [bacterium]|nr:cell division protein ZapA [bacterium]